MLCLLKPDNSVHQDERGALIYHNQLLIYASVECDFRAWCPIHSKSSNRGREMSEYTNVYL